MNTRSHHLPEENDVWRFSLPRGFLTVKLQASVWTNTQTQWNSEMRTPVGHRKKHRLCWVSAAFWRAQEKEVLLPDLIRISIELLRVRLNVLVTVQRPPSHPSFLTANSSSRRISTTTRLGLVFPAPLCFFSSVLLVPSKPEWGSARPRPSVPALVGLQSEEPGRGVCI